MRVRASGVGAEKAIIKQFPSRLNIPFEARFECTSTCNIDPQKEKGMLKLFAAAALVASLTA
jgi:hypothetical protein